MARESIWALLQAAAKPELRKVFAAMSMRPCWLDTGESHMLINSVSTRRSTPQAHHTSAFYCVHTMMGKMSILEHVQLPKPCYNLGMRQ